MICSGYRDNLALDVENTFDDLLRDLLDFKTNLMQKDDFGRWEFDRVQLHDLLLDIMEKL